MIQNPSSPLEIKWCDLSMNIISGFDIIRDSQLFTTNEMFTTTIQQHLRQVKMVPHKSMVDRSTEKIKFRSNASNGVGEING